MNDREFYSSLIRLHILHHAVQEPIFGLGIIEELARHGYKLSAGTLYPMLHNMERKGYLYSIEERSGRQNRRLYRATNLGKISNFDILAYSILHISKKGSKMGQPINQDSVTKRSSLSSRLKELAQLFLKLGTIGFGGPQAHIAMIHDEAVVRRGWLNEEQFIEGVAVCEMLPGPASTQMGIYTGYLRAGQWGALVAGFCFILPAFFIVLTLSWAYFRFQGVPQIDDLFLGISPVVIAIIFGFCWKLAKKAIKDWKGVAIAVAVLLITVLFQVNVLLQFILAGMVGLILYRPKQPPPFERSNRTSAWLFPLLPIAFLGFMRYTQHLPPALCLKANNFVPHQYENCYILQGLAKTFATSSGETLTLSSFCGLERIQEYFVPLTLFFLKVGSFIFGGGLVIIPLLEFEVVNQFQWLTRNEFIDGVAIGELTPGPVVITAAFVGYKVAGALGASIAAIAIFTPSFLFIMGAAPFLLRIRRNPWIRSFLKGVTPAVLGAIAAAAVPLAQAAILQDTLERTIIAVIVGAIALIALIRFKRPTWQLVPAGAVVGLIAGAFCDYW
jgi:chromate transporter